MGFFLEAGRRAFPFSIKAPKSLGEVGRPMPTDKTPRAVCVPVSSQASQVLSHTNWEKHFFMGRRVTMSLKMLADTR